MRSGRACAYFFIAALFLVATFSPLYIFPRFEKRGRPNVADEDEGVYSDDTFDEWDSYMYDTDMFATSGSRIGASLAPFVPTPQRAVAAAIKMARVRAGDIVYELGAGDARFCIRAALVSPDVRCVAIENNLSRVQISKLATRKAGVEDQVQVVHADLLEYDFSEATVVFFFLLPSPLNTLSQKLKAVLKRGGRLVSMVFKLSFLRAVATRQEAVNYVADGYTSNLYLYTSASLQNNEDDSPFISTS